MTVQIPALTDINAWADYWYYSIGVNVIPADTKKKKTWVKWSEWQDKPIPEEVYEQWKSEGQFNNGIAIIVGKIWRGCHEGKYLIFVDCDNQRAIEEFCTRNGKQTSLQKIATKFLVEQHKDNTSKAHIYFISEIPFPKKSSDVGKPALTAKLSSGEIPSFEVKGQGTHGIAYCTPSIHRDGQPYEIVGNPDPEVLNVETAKQLEQHLDNICKRYGLHYLDGEEGHGNQSLTKRLKLWEEDTIIYQGNNRHGGFLACCDSLLVKYPGEDITILKKFAELKNQKMCVPPLPQSDVDSIWKQAVDWSAKKLHEGQNETEREKAAVKPGKQDQSKHQAKNHSSNVMTVSEALRIESSQCAVEGMIVSVSMPYMLISKTTSECLHCNYEVTMEHNPPIANRGNRSKRCPSCKQSDLRDQSDYISALSIQIQDTSQPICYLEHLDVILLGRDTTSNVTAGEIVKVTGEIHIVQRSGDRRLLPVLYCSSIKYERRDDLKITERDKKSFQQFAKMPNLIQRLTSMVAPNVIGHEDKKIGLLRSAIGAPENSRRGRINTLFVGPPGTAKSTLAREASKMMPNARYVTSPHASGKSITAIIDKVDDNTILRLGPIPLSKNSICVINEIGKMSFEDQGYLFDIMEEGKFAINKYGISREIDSPTTIIATANPYRVEWSEAKANKNEIPVDRVLLDRFDQIFIFRDYTTEMELRNYADDKIEYDERQIDHNYRFLKKYIQYAKTLEPVMTESAKEMLKEFWLQLKQSGDASNRTLDSIFRMAKAQARMQLRDTVDEEIAKQTMNAISAIMAEYGQAIAVVAADPRQVAYDAIVNVVQETEVGITFEQAVKKACDYEPQVKQFLGDNLKIRENKRLRTLRQRFVELRDDRITITGISPLTLKRSLGSLRS